MLNIVTPLTRPENLDEIFSTISPHQGSVNWYIVVDQSIRDQYEYVETRFSGLGYVYVLPPVTTAIAGHSHRNRILDLLEKSNPDQWFYSLDDDNVLYDEFVHTLLRSTKDGLIVSQSLPSGILRLRASHDNVRLNCIDTAQFAFRLRIVEGLRFDPNRYDADGVFIEELYHRDPSKFEIIDIPLCYYNYLK